MIVQLKIALKLILKKLRSTPLILIFSTNLFPAFGQGGFSDVDFLMKSPYSFLGKTDFQIASQGQPTGWSDTSWKMESGIPKSKDQYEKYFRIQTGYGTLIYLMISPKTSRVFVVDIKALFEVNFEELKNYLIKRYQINFNDYGFSQVLTDQYTNESYVIKLTTNSENWASLVFYGIDSNSKAFRFMDN